MDARQIRQYCEGYLQHPKRQKIRKKRSGIKGCVDSLIDAALAGKIFLLYYSDVCLLHGHPLWSSGQDYPLSPGRPGFDSPHRKPFFPFLQKCEAIWFLLPGRHDLSAKLKI